MEGGTIAIDGHTVLSNGTLIARMGAPIEIRPFAQQPNYTMTFQCRTVVMDEKQSSRIVAEEGGVRIEHLHEWSNFNESITSRTVFASAGNDLYMIDYYLKIVGNPDHYNYIFSYTIYAEAA